MVILNRDLPAGTLLTGTLKKTVYQAEVVETPEGIRYRVNGKEYKSPSAAASAAMNGVSANGWKFWSLQGAEPAAGEQTPKPEKARKAATKTTKAPTPEAASKVEDELAVEG